MVKKKLFVKSQSTEMVQYDHFRLVFAGGQNSIRNPKSMPEKPTSPASVLSDYEEEFLHDVDELERILILKWIPVTLN